MTERAPSLAQQITAVELAASLAVETMRRRKQPPSQQGELRRRLEAAIETLKQQEEACQRLPSS